MLQKLIYLSTFYPPTKLDYYMKKMRSAANISASAFSYSLLSGLTANNVDDLYVINTPLTGPFPNNYCRLVTNEDCTDEYGISVESIRIFNLYGEQELSIYTNVYNAMCQLNVGNADILIYSIQIPLLKAAAHYKKKNKGSRIFLIVPDLYEDLKKRFFPIQLIKKILIGDYYSLSQDIDGYVLLTEQMIERMPYKRPYCVVEGIYNPSELRKKQSSEKDVFTILYSGMLYERFGVKNLIDAFCSLKSSNVKLQLCGSGELKEYIINKQKEDNRIEYLGIVSREMVLKLQSAASLLVNPRQPNDGFTRYSFPSKNIEYLASGTPTLMYELEGIPADYYKYCYHLSAKQSSVKELANMINSIIEEPVEKRADLAQKAHDFIISNKSAPVQCAKIISFINNI